MKVMGMAEIPAHNMQVRVEINRTAVEQLDNASLEALAQEVLAERTRRQIKFTEELEGRAVEEPLESLQRFVKDRLPTAFNAGQCLKIAQVFISRAEELGRTTVFAPARRPTGF